MIYTAGYETSEALGKGLGAAVDAAVLPPKNQPNQVLANIAYAVVIWEIVEVTAFMCILASIFYCVSILRTFATQLAKLSWVPLGIAALIACVVIGLLIRYLYLPNASVGPNALTSTIASLQVCIPLIVVCLIFSASTGLLVASFAYGALCTMPPNYTEDRREEIVSMVAVRVATARRLMAFLMVAILAGGLSAEAYYHIAAAAIPTSTPTPSLWTLIIDEVLHLMHVERPAAGDGLRQNLELFAFTLGVLIAAGATVLVLAMHGTTMAILFNYVPLDELWPGLNPVKYRLKRLRQAGILDSTVKQRLGRLIIAASPVVLSVVIPQVLPPLLHLLGVPDQR
jgi:hypothetical protein